MAKYYRRTEKKFFKNVKYTKQVLCQGHSNIAHMYNGRDKMDKNINPDFTWLALRLGLGILCMITNSAFLISQQQKSKTLFNKNYLHVTLFYFYSSGF